MWDKLSTATVRETAFLDKLSEVGQAVQRRDNLTSGQFIICAEAGAEFQRSHAASAMHRSRFIPCWSSAKTAASSGEK